MLDDPTWPGNDGANISILLYDQRSDETLYNKIAGGKMDKLLTYNQ